MKAKKKDYRCHVHDRIGIFGSLSKDDVMFNLEAHFFRLSKGRKLLLALVATSSSTVLYPGVAIVTLS